jgi:hypothetical protein
MFIATNHLLKYSSLREERNVFPNNLCAWILRSPTEHKPNSVTSGYKHLAPCGEIRSHQLVNLKLETTIWTGRNAYPTVRMPERNSMFYSVTQ